MGAWVLEIKIICKMVRTMRGRLGQGGCAEQSAIGVLAAECQPKQVQEAGAHDPGQQQRPNRSQKPQRNRLRRSPLQRFWRRIRKILRRQALSQLLDACQPALLSHVGRLDHAQRQHADHDSEREDEQPTAALAPAVRGHADVPRIHHSSENRFGPRGWGQSLRLPGSGKMTSCRPSCG